MKNPVKELAVLFFLLSGALHGFEAQQGDAAQRAWDLYLPKIRAAAKNHDRAALKSLMAPLVSVSGGVGDDDHDGDNRDDALDFLDTPNLGAWRELGKLMAKGAVPASWVKEEGHEGNPHRISPPSARKGNNLKEGEWVAIFEYRENRWVLITFTECCD